MAAGSSENSGKLLFDFIDKAIKEVIGEAFDKAIEQAVEDAKAKRDETIAKVALRLTTQMRIEEVGQTIRIEIGKEL